MLLTVPQSSRFGIFLRDIGPVFSAVARDLHQPIVGARPDHARFFRRLRNRENRARIFHADVVGSEPAGNSLPAFVVARQVGTDNLPAIAAISCDVHKLAAHINLVVIVRRNRDREFPVKPILHFRRGCSGNVHRPNLDFAGLAIPFVEARHRAADASRAGAARPDDVVVHGIRRGESALAACLRDARRCAESVRPGLRRRKIRRTASCCSARETTAHPACCHKRSRESGRPTVT